MANHPSTRHTGTIRTSTSIVNKTRGMVDMAAGTTREGGMIVWAALIREDIKEAPVAADATAALVATKSPTKTTKATNRTRATSPTREATSPRAGTSPEGATRTNTTTGTDEVGAVIEGDVDIHNNIYYVACKLRSTPVGILQCVTGN